MVAAIIAGLGLACGPHEKPLNLLVIGVDTLRPDHLGCYGYARDTSPAIDRLASEGVLFEDVVSQAPWTLPSFATMFTSLYPSQHGANTAVTAMRTSFPTLATILKERGYATGAIINAAVLRPEYGVNRGFDYYDPTPPQGRIADGTTRDALKWIDDSTGTPFFLFAHYYDPHEPYAPPAPYDTLYRGDYRGQIGDSFVLSEHFPTVTGTNFDDLRTLSPADWDRIESLYDGEIAFTDAAIQNLLQGLRDRGLQKRTLIIFLSDHGEEFFGHKGFGHGHTLFREVIRVPLIVSLPGRLPAGRRIDRQVRLVDVMPTVLELLNITGDIHCEGVSLVPLLMGKTEVVEREGALFPARIAYSEGLLRGSERKGITAYPWKLIYDLATREDMVFNFESDPGETVDLASTRPEQARGLRDLLISGLFGLAGTWYIGMVPSDSGNTFDVAVEAASDLGVGHVYLAALLDGTGHVAGAGRELSVAANGIRISDLHLEVPGTLAFQVDAPPMLPLIFDVSIDGIPAAGKTFIGKDLAVPDKTPFSIEARGGRARAGEAGDQGIPHPAVTVRFTPPRYTGKTAVQLDEKTRQGLRALGYIQ
jgi:arylsulfatase A-like enzyme